MKYLSLSTYYLITTCTFIAIVLLSLTFSFLQNDLSQINVTLIIYYLFISFQFVLFVIYFDVIKFSDFLKFIIFFMITLVNVTVIIVIFYTDTGMFFDYQMADTLFYHNTIIGINKIKDILYVVDSYPELGFDDIGTLLYVYLLYNVVDSPLMIYGFNVFLHSLSTLMFYRICKYVAAGIVNKSSLNIVVIIHLLMTYGLYFSSAHFKESVFYFFTLSSFYFYINYNTTKNKFQLLISLISILTLFLFRIGVPIMILSSLILYYTYINKKNIRGTIFIILSMVSTVIIYYTANTVYFNYLNIDYLSYYVETSSYGFGYTIYTIISVISASIGPFPTIYPSDNLQMQNIYSFGYYLKVMSFPFIISGIYSSLFESKTKYGHILKIMAIYYIINSLIFGLILRGFDIRFLYNGNFIYIVMVLIGYNNYRIKGMPKVMLLSFVLLFFIIVFDSRLW